jgi:hypothetical protein
MILFGVALGAAPPDIINYQGVLRDSAGNPLDGSYVMTFVFYDDEIGGTDILRESHGIVSSPEISVDQGMFTVALGTGYIEDGNGPGLYLSMNQVFRDYTNVWMRISVEYETLSPRVPIRATPYAHNSYNAQSAQNADTVGGQAPSTFLDTTASTQTKAGNLNVDGILTAGGGRLNMDFSSTIATNGTDTSLTFDVDNNGTAEMTIGPFGTVNIPDNLRVSNGLYVSSIQNQLTLHDPEGSFEGQPGIYFTTAAGTKVFSWRGGFNYFRMTDNLLVDGYVNATQLQVGSGLLDWDSSQSRFEFNQRLAVNGPLRIGTDAGTATAYSFVGPSGSSNPDSSAMNAVNDFYVAGDLEAQTYWGDRFESSTSTFNLNGNDNRFNTAGQHRVMIDSDNSTTSNFVGWYHDGTYSTATQLARMEEDGDFRIGGTLSQNQVFDLAESFWASEPLKPGDLVAADPDHPGAVQRATGDSHQAVLGVVSSKPGVLLGSAPFDAEGLRRAWGDEIHGRFVGARDRIEAELLQEKPELVALSIGETDELRNMDHDEDGLESILLDRFFEENVVAVALAGRVPVQVDASFGSIAVGDPLAPSDLPGVARKADGQTVAVAIALEPLESGRGTVLGFVTRFETAGDALEELESRTPDPVTGVQELAGNLQVVLDQGADDEARFSIHRDGAAVGKVGDEIFRVDESGNVFARGAFRPHAMDLAEFFELSEPVEAGDVIAIDLENPGLCRLASEANDPAVVGIVSTEPGLLLGGSVQRIAAIDHELAAELELARELGDGELEEQIWNRMTTMFMENHAAIALSGTVPVKVDAGYGAIRPGDLLISSPTPGHAMRADDPAPGAVIGKALAELENGVGVIRALVD